MERLAILERVHRLVVTIGLDQRIGQRKTRAERARQSRER
jgi:hypothetical protein